MARPLRRSRRRMPERYWLVHPNGGRQLIDPRQFDLDRLAEHARRIGGRVVVERDSPPTPAKFAGAVAAARPTARLRRSSSPRSRHSRRSSSAGSTRSIPASASSSSTSTPGRPRASSAAITRRGGWSGSTRTTGSSAGGPWKSSSTPSSTRLRTTSNTPSPTRSTPASCGRVPGRMHSRLFWRILGELKGRWADLQKKQGDGLVEPAAPSPSAQARPLTPIAQVASSLSRQSQLLDLRGEVGAGLARC